MVGAKQRAAAVPVSRLPGKLPEVDVPEDVDHENVVKTALKNLSLGLKAQSLTDDAIWRDLFSMTGTLRTFYGNKKIEAAWRDRSQVHEPANFTLIPGSSGVMRRGPNVSWVKGMFSFVTHGKPNSIGSGIINLIPVEGASSWKVWCICTILERIHGLSNVDVFDPETATQGETKNGPTSRPVDFDCVICGGGQAGLSIAGRLKAGGVKNYVVLEKFDVIGGNWLDRYDSVKLHTSKDISQLPFGRIFPPDDPYYLTGRHIARGYQRFTDKYGLNVWCSTELQYASYDEKESCWNLNINRNGEPQTVTARHLVLALGPGGTVPKMPTFPNRDAYKGTVLHSAHYKNPHAWKGKKAIIIGSANTAHDVADDMINAGLSSVTLVQRSPTCIVPAEYMRANVEPLYNASSNIEVVDRIFMAMPTAVQRIMMNNGINGMAKKEPERFDALEKKGFKVDRDVDMIHILFERVGGHYMDVGTSAKVADGTIKVKSDAAVTSYTETGLAFSDGTTLEAEVIVFSTGFVGNPRDQVCKIIGPEMEEKLEDMWCCDKEGEVRGLWKPIGHPGIWYAGGGISTTRFYSRFLALQIQADLAGTPLPVYYDDPEVE
ncbi:FAD/NAD(P)-binding domain-containing protein [Rhizodiscina lignyota]|uniref:FAD/NAD(P)-binding domain-containing protein n=1 Tax=Rhizodiscina lignyota TaxID=1504668 RepID=A0A9P4IAC8_9PEZI|nr:FAD/NAD(P)-binding domain-containing protein [Rhizodiscina lignyota]